MRRTLAAMPLLLGLAARGQSAGTEAPAPPPCSAGQTFVVDGIGTSTAELRRLAGLAGLGPLHPELFLRTSGAPALSLCAEGASAGTGDATAQGVEVALAPLRWRSFFNSAYPNERNDGALWAGRGLSTELQGGLTARWRFLSVGIRPTVAYQQNRPFSLPERAPAGYHSYSDYNLVQGYGIDLPIRFGDRPFWTFDPGQSFLRVDAFNVAAGLSTENLWWGPGVRNSLLLSNTAPGFPHVFLGTSRPADVAVGTLEAQYLVGQLAESPYFNADPADDRRLMAALTLGFSPSFLPGLSLGAARVYIYGMQNGGPSVRDLFVPLLETFLKQGLVTPDNPYGQRGDNQLFSVFGRWAVPQAGLELYGEWARDDHNWGALDLAMEPDHSSAYLLGLQKLLPVGPYWLRLNAELTHVFERPVSDFWRATPSFYTHYKLRQGYTHRGQMLGAAIGPGGDSQYATADLFYARGRTGLFLERTLRNELYYFHFIRTPEGHDLELTGGVRQAWSWAELDVSGELGLSRRWNRDFGGHDTNVSLMAQLTWWPGRTRPPALPAFSARPAPPAVP